MRRMSANTRLPAAQPRPEPIEPSLDRHEVRPELPKAKPRAARKPVPRRRPAPPRWRRQAWRVGAFGSLLLALVIGGGWVWHARLPATAWNDLHATIVYTSANAGLRLGKVVVDGRLHTPREELVASLGVQLGQPMLEIDPQALKAKLEALGWVRSALVERRLPDQLYIRLSEAEPVALWQHDGAFRLIDRAGQVIDKAEASAFSQLPVLVGDGAPAHAADLLAMLAREPDLAARVHGAVWVGERRWNLRFDNGVDVKLPADSPQTAWSQLAKLEREQHLLARDVTVIDMRLPDRLTVRLGSGAEVQQGNQTHQPGSST
jgi:cell division protein FtsQ